MRNIEEKLFDYLEGRLSETEKLKIEAALAKDPSLRKLINAITETDGILTEQKVETPGNPLFTQEVMWQIASRPLRQRTSNRLMFMVLGIFTGILAVVAMLPATEPATVPSGGKWLGLLQRLPKLDTAPLVETLITPAMLQLAMIAAAIALLLIVDQLIRKKFWSGRHFFI